MHRDQRIALKIQCQFEIYTHNADILDHFFAFWNNVLTCYVALMNGRPRVKALLPTRKSNKGSLPGTRIIQ